MSSLAGNIFAFTLIVLTAILEPSLASQSNELLILNRARELYATGKFEASIEEYNKIQKDSDFWIDAVEEKAWAYTNKKQYGKAKAELRSILNPIFLPLVSSEAIMLSAFVDLKVCNYKGVAEAIPLFKNTMLPRVSALEEVVQNKNPALVKKWVQNSREQTLRQEQVGEDALKLPRFFHRVKNLTDKKMKSMAQEELAQISKNLKKMKILEIELIHRTQISDVKTAEDKKLKFDKAQSKDALVFPVKEGSQEIWMDEIGKFETETTQCPQGSTL